MGLLAARDDLGIFALGLVIAGVVGGLIAAAAGYYAVFGVSMLFLAIGLTLMLTRVEEPRKRRAAG